MPDNLFLFVIWSKARRFEGVIRAELAARFKIVYECEITWPRWDFTNRLWNFYGFGTRFMWWNKGRKCGRGPFKVIVTEDPAPEWQSQCDTSGRNLLMDDRVYNLKQSLRKITGHANIVHSSVTPAETREQLAALGLAHILDEGTAIPDPAALERRLLGGELKLLGAGSRRECHEIPGTNLCLKCYRDERTVTGAVAREIRRYRHDERRNTCCQEYRYWCELKRRLPAYVFSAFPETMAQIHLPTRGWAVIENSVLNDNESPCTRFSEAYRSASEKVREDLFREFWLLMGSLAAYAVRFYDTQNIIVQNSAMGFRLRIVDFEPAARTLIPIDGLCSTMVHDKAIRRAERYCWNHLGVRFRYKGLSPRVRRTWDAGVVGGRIFAELSNCRAFLENKTLNDLFYRGEFSGRPCVVKCSSVSAESLARETALLRDLHARDPRHFPEVLDFRMLHDRAILVMEDVGETSLMDLIVNGIGAPDADRLATDILSIAGTLASAGIVHRDLWPANFLIGADGHLRLIDFQMAVNCNDYREIPWAQRHPTYLYVVFGQNRDLRLGHWNDVSSLVRMLGRFPQTEVVISVLGKLREMEPQGLVSKPPRGLVYLRLKIHQLSLRVQSAFGRGEKRRRIDMRLCRFERGAL